MASPSISPPTDLPPRIPVISKTGVEPFPFPKIPDLELLVDDGEPMESEWHVRNMTSLIDSIDVYFGGRSDYHVGGNQFIYFSEEQARNRDFRGPDFYFVWNTTREPMRDCWVVWLEGGRLPNVIIELTSPSTIDDDYGVKRDVYRDIMRTPNYFIYDRTSPRLNGWQLDRGVYLPLDPNPEGRLWSSELKLWVGPWEGEIAGFQATWLRFFSPEGILVPLASEFEKHLADRLRTFAESENQRAELENQRAEQERQRAENAESEVTRLKEQIAAMQAQAKSEV